MRQRFEKRFSARRMANDYVRVYQSLVRPSHAGAGSRAGAPVKTIDLTGDAVHARISAAE